jgi:hypothetical protein
MDYGKAPVREVKISPPNYQSNLLNAAFFPQSLSPEDSAVMRSIGVFVPRPQFSSPCIHARSFTTAKLPDGNGTQLRFRPGTIPCGSIEQCPNPPGVFPMVRRLITLSALLLCTAGFASAESFNFTYTGTIGAATTASGTLITTAEGNGEFLVTGITNGLFDGKAITSILAPGATESYTMDANDNMLYYPAQVTGGIFSSAGLIDYNGLGFSTAAGEGNFYFNGSSYALSSNLGVADILGKFTLTPDVAPTPEPSSIILLGTGLLGSLGVLRRKVMA